MNLTNNISGNITRMATFRQSDRIPEKLRNPKLKDFGRHWLIISILCVGMLPLWGEGYCMYVIALLFPLALININVFSGVVLIFSFLYTLPLVGPLSLPPSEIVFYMTFPLIMFHTGMYLGEKLKYPANGIAVMALMIICLALPAIVVNIQDSLTTGNLVNVTRIIVDEHGDVGRKATGYGMMVSLVVGCIGLILVRTDKKTLDHRLKFLLVSFSFLGLFCVVHLVNRTGLVLAVASIIAALFVPPVSVKKFIYVLLTFLALSVIGYVYISDTPGLADAVTAYVDRNTGTQSIAGASGRGLRWVATIKQIAEHPLGSPHGLRFNLRHSFAHNLWLDTGLLSGVLTMVFLIGITLKYLLEMYRALRLKYLDNFQKGVVLLLCVTFMLQSAVEPIIQGCFQFFLFMFFSIGLFSKFNRRFRYGESDSPSPDNLDSKHSN